MWRARSRGNVSCSPRDGEKIRAGGGGGDSDVLSAFELDVDVCTCTHAHAHMHMHMVHMHMPTRPGHGKSARTIQRHTDASRPRNTAFTATARRRRHQHFRHRHRSGLRSGHRTSHSQSERHRTDCHGCLVDQPHAECPRPESARRCAGIALPRVSTDRGPLAGLNIRKPLWPREEYLLFASSPRAHVATAPGAALCLP